ncbi:MAG TPA: hypothetical protein PKG90_02940 [Chitinophagaceae bacterium]|nr:hypothetical protein [Chitinophagaceae bacterium]HNU15530.1 hypothetical protein [Chitinophagaceae bacterium]
MNHNQPGNFLQIASSLQKQGFNDDQITLQLREQGVPDNLLQEVIQQLKTLRITRKRNTGFACCGIGVALLIIGCMLTILLYGSGGDIKLAMYGLTTIGVIFTLKGLADIMGW